MNQSRPALAEWRNVSCLPSLTVLTWNNVAGGVLR
jgi:hypothetical protein